MKEEMWPFPSFATVLNEPPVDGLTYMDTYVCFEDGWMVIIREQMERKNEME